MNVPKASNAANYVSKATECEKALLTKKRSWRNYIAMAVGLCLIVTVAVWLHSRSTNDSLKESSIFSDVPAQRPIAAYLQADVSSFELEHIVEGKRTIHIVEGDALELWKKWTNDLRPTEISAGKWIVDFENGNTPDQMEGGEVFTVTVSPSDYNNGSCGFSYCICGPDEHSLLDEGNWFLVKNPSCPPVYQ